MCKLLLIFLLFQLSQKDKFYQDAQTNWSQYEKKIRTLQGTIGFAFKGTLGNVTTSGVERYVSDNNGSKLLVFIQINKKKKTSEIVYCTNPRYSFHLKDRKIIEISEPNKFDEQFERFWIDASDTLRLIHNQYLPELIKNPNFRYLDQTTDANGWIEVHFDTLDDKQDGYMTFVPSHDYALMSYDMNFNGKGYTGKAKFRVNRYLENLPLAKEATLETDILLDKKRNKQIWYFKNDMSVPEKLPNPEEFTLAAFGLPEPKLPEVPGFFRLRNIVLMILFSMVILTGIAIKLRRLRCTG